MPVLGNIVTQWLPDGRHMQLVEAATYVDKTGRHWPAPAGFITDGASIPGVLWSIVGSPYTGDYRVGAVFHDVAYATLGVSKADADNMLRECALELGCSEFNADIIYDGVRFGGLESYLVDQRAAARRLGSL